MKIIGMDIASTTGITHLDDERLVFCAPFRWEGEYSGQVYRSFRKRLYMLIEKYEITHAAAEEPLRTDAAVIPGRLGEDGIVGPKTTAPMATFQRLYGLCAVAEEACEALKVDFRYVNQGTWRKSFTGSGKATKEDSLALARLVDRSISSFDAAESMGVAWWLRGQLNPKYAAPRGDLFEAPIMPKERLPF